MVIAAVLLTAAGLMLAGCSNPANPVNSEPPAKPLILPEDDESGTSRTLIGIRIIREPSRVIYEIGGGLDHTGLVVNAIYNDGSEKDVTERVWFSSAGRTDMPGKQTVVIEYGGFTAQYSIWCIFPGASMDDFLMLKTGNSGGGWWDQYWQGETDLYPSVQGTFAATTSYEVTISGHSDKAMNRLGFLIATRTPSWAVFANPTPQAIPAGDFSVTYDVTLSQAINITDVGQYIIQLVNLGTDGDGLYAGSLAAVITGLEFTMTPVNAFPMTKTGSSGTGWWDQYWEGETDLYPGVQGTFAAATHTVTISGHSSKAMSRLGFLIATRTPSWAVFANPSPQAIPAGNFSVTYDVTLSQGITITNAGQYIIQLVNLGTDGDGVNAGDVAATITNLDVSIDAFPMTKTGSSGTGWWDQYWEGETDLYTFVQGTLAAGSHSITITGNSDKGLYNFSFFIATRNPSWATFNDVSATVSNASTADGAFTYTKTFTLDSAITITGPGQYIIQLVRLGSNGDGVNAGDVAATITNLDVSITP
ncbi:hypothetical protein FACS189479_05150 [Spirochaetia bacterium]|nr:hypothetical protein FACS189479_05150 [Spirochaetia bacterium]